MMNEQTKRQVLKALAYGTDKAQIKKVMNISDEDIDSISVTEIETEKKYYKEMGYIK